MINICHVSLKSVYLVLSEEIDTQPKVKVLTDGRATAGRPGNLMPPPPIVGGEIKYRFFQSNFIVYFCKLQ